MTLAAKPAGTRDEAGFGGSATLFGLSSAI